MNDAKAVFLNALDCATPEELSRFLDDACAGDASLKARVDELLRAHREAGSFLGGGWPSSIEDQLAEAPGTVVGPYTLLEQIGEGGFGIVFLAEQQQPVRRRVALKVIKPGMDTREVIARFEAERQALAIMDHPNIARVLDAGATDSGRPYFVMELVRGVAITQYCDQHSLTPRERLELFLSVCHAVQHAHQKGIIHRDIKPSNVLVTSHDGRPLVKVIDFGVAKAVSGQLGEHTVYTRFAQLIGTPLYMSPEQAEMSSVDIDTRSDIYSLGVLLYELLTGTTPFDRRRLAKAALDEVRRIIREEDPPNPSTRLSESGDSLASIAANRHTEPARLTKLIRGELDWIVMKALEKDRKRRYETANGLASDVERYLLDEPVSAAAPSRFYRVSKFVRRNRLPVIASAAVLIALVAGFIGTTIGIIGQVRERAIAEGQRTEAETAKDTLQAVNDFLLHDVFAGVETDRMPDKAVRDQIVKVMIDPAAATVAERFRDKPLVEAKVRQALANAYESVGRGDLALPHSRMALEIHRRILGPDHRDTMTSAELLGTLLRALGQYAEAEPLLRESLAGHRKAFGDDHEDTIFSLNSMATLYQSQGNFALAESLYREALGHSRHALGNDSETTITLINNLGYVLLMQGKLDKAEPLLTESYERCPRVLGESHRGTLRSIDNMGVLRSAQGRVGEAEPFYRDALERSRRVLGDDDPHTLHAVNDLGGLLMEQGKFDEAEPMLRDTLARRQRVLGADHPDTLVSLTNLGLFLRRKGDLIEAEPLTREALERSRRVKGDDHVDSLFAITNMGTLLMAQLKWDQAEPFVREAHERCQRVLSDSHALKATAIYNLGALLYYQGKPDEAEPLYLDALERRRRLLGDDHLETLHVKDNLGLLRQDQGEFEQAERLFRDTLAGYQRALQNADHFLIGDERLNLGGVLAEQLRFPEAEAELLEAERVLGEAQGVQTGSRQRCFEALIHLYEAWDKAEPGHGRDAKAREWQARLSAMP